MIFSFSSQNAQTSSQLSYKVSCTIIRTADRILDVGLEEWQIEDYAARYHHVTRKIAHMGEYFLLAVTVSFPLYVYGLHGILLMILAGVICVGFACGDEYHQSFVAGRGPAVKDVCIDTFGVFWGIVLVRIVGWTGRHTIFRPLRRADKELSRSRVRQLQNAQDEMRSRQEAIRQEQRQAKKERRRLQRELDIARMEEENRRQQSYDPGAGSRGLFWPNSSRRRERDYGSAHDARGERYDRSARDPHNERYDEYDRSGRDIRDDRYDQYDSSGRNIRDDRYDQYDSSGRDPRDGRMSYDSGRNDRYDARFNDRYDDRYNDRYDDRYDRDSYDDPAGDTSDYLSEDMPLSRLLGSRRRQKHSDS